MFLLVEFGSKNIKSIILESKQMDEIEQNQNISIIPLGIFPKHLQGFY